LAADVARGDAVGVDGVAHPGQGRAVLPGGRERRGRRLDDQPRLVGAAHVLGRDVRDARAAVGEQLDEAVGGQAAERLADRRARHAELGGEVLLAQLGVMGQVAREDALAQRRVRAVDDADDVQPVRLDRHAPPTPASRGPAAA
jgi:hypothetical protein